MLSFEVTGFPGKTEAYLKSLSKKDIYKVLDSAGQRGVAALSAATPKDSGATASSWKYRVEKSSKGARIYWENTNVVGGTPLVILLQYGHGTGTGGYVQGRDFINPAMKPIFDSISNDVWRAVITA